MELGGLVNKMGFDKTEVPMTVLKAELENLVKKEHIMKIICVFPLS